MLDQQQIEFYREQGYLLVEDVIDADLLARLRDAAEADDRAVARGARERCRVRPRRGPLGRDAQADARQAPAPQRAGLRRGAARTRIKAVLQELLGPTVRLQTTKLNTKAPGGGAAVEWHQDWAFYPHTNDDLLAIGLILADVDEANGPLMVIPGSHKGPTLDHTRNGVFAGAIDPDDPASTCPRP